MELHNLKLILDILSIVLLLSMFAIIFIGIRKKILSTSDIKMKIAYIFIGVVNIIAMLLMVYIRYYVRTLV